MNWLGRLRRRRLQRRWEAWVDESEQLLLQWNERFPRVPRPLPAVDDPRATKITEVLLGVLEAARADLR